MLVFMKWAHANCLFLHPLKTSENIFFALGFLSCIFTIHSTTGEGGSYLNSLYHLHPLHRQLHISHSWQSDLNREPLVSKRKSLTASHEPHLAMLLFQDVWKDTSYMEWSLAYLSASRIKNSIRIYSKCILISLTKQCKKY